MHGKVLALYGTRLRQHFQCFRWPANLVQPRSQRGERFIGEFRASLVSLCETRCLSKALHSIGNVLIRQNWILPRTNFKCQELVIRPGIGMIFKRARHFRQADRSSGLSWWWSGAEWGSELLARFFLVHVLW